MFVLLTCVELRIDSLRWFCNVSESGRSAVPADPGVDCLPGRTGAACLRRTCMCDLLHGNQKIKGRAQKGRSGRSSTQVSKTVFVLLTCVELRIDSFLQKRLGVWLRVRQGGACCAWEFPTVIRRTGLVRGTTAHQPAQCDCCSSFLQQFL